MFLSPKVHGNLKYYKVAGYFGKLKGSSSHQQKFYKEEIERNNFFRRKKQFPRAEESQEASHYKYHWLWKTKDK